MADVKIVDQGSDLPEKRKLNLPSPLEKSPQEDKDSDGSSKRQKVGTPTGENGSVSLPDSENAAKSDEHLDVHAAADEEDEEDEEDYNAEQEEDEDDDVSRGADKVDRKGKGIMADVKGKGKLIEDSEDDDSDGHVDGDEDSSDDSGSDFSDGLDGSDLDDDPLAEVDLDNILPSRTRQRQVHHGVRIVNDSDKGNDA